jgi:hypothetical protein
MFSEQDILPEYSAQFPFAMTPDKQLDSCNVYGLDLVSRDTSVCLATRYGMGGRCSIPGSGKMFSFFRSVQTDSLVHASSCTASKEAGA